MTQWGRVPNLFDGGPVFSQIKSKLKNVKQICASENAFAAVLENGTVVTWGDDLAGGDSSTVQHRLVNVQSISSSSLAFAALVGVGIHSCVVTWGCPPCGDSSKVQDQLTNVLQVKGSVDSFMAFKANGTVVTWGGDDMQESSSVAEQLVPYLD